MQGTRYRLRRYQYHKYNTYKPELLKRELKPCKTVSYERTYKDLYDRNGQRYHKRIDYTLTVVSSPEKSILATSSGIIAPMFKPLGLSDYRFSTALITGFLAKESVVSTLTVLFGSEAAVLTAMTGVSAAAMLVFCLLYTPCVAAVASVKRELGRKYACFMVIFQCVVAWICAALVNLIGNLIF